MFYDKRNPIIRDQKLPAAAVCLVKNKTFWNLLGILIENDYAAGVIREVSGDILAFPFHSVNMCNDGSPL